MASKRKRSSDDSPLSISSFGGITSTPDSLSPTPFPSRGDEGAMDLDPTTLSTTSRFNFDFGRRTWGLPVTRVDGSDLGSRTRKRSRDNRPDERAIHRKTMDLLFSAQRTPAAHAPPPPSTPDPEPVIAQSRPQKSTLHSFWNLPAPPVTIQPPTPTPSSAFGPLTQPQAHPHIPNCNNCNSLLQNNNDSMDMDVDMDMNGAVTGGASSGMCATVSRTRHCIQCATKGKSSRRWW